jgi:hypothetical protein
MKEYVLGCASEGGLGTPHLPFSIGIGEQEVRFWAPRTGSSPLCKGS